MIFRDTRMSQPGGARALSAGPCSQELPVSGLGLSPGLSGERVPSQGGALQRVLVVFRLGRARDGESGQSGQLLLTTSLLQTLPSLSAPGPPPPPPAGGLFPASWKCFRPSAVTPVPFCLCVYILAPCSTAMWSAFPERMGLF